METGPPTGSSARPLTPSWPSARPFLPPPVRTRTLSGTHLTCNSNVRNSSRRAQSDAEFLALVGILGVGAGGIDLTGLVGHVPGERVDVAVPPGAKRKVGFQSALLVGDGLDAGLPQAAQGREITSS